MLSVQSGPMLKLLLNRGAGPSMPRTVKRHLLGKVISSRDVSILRTLLDSQVDLSFIKKRRNFNYVMQVAAGAGTAMFEYVMQYT